jgi:hypothetical protein
MPVPESIRARLGTGFQGHRNSRVAAGTGRMLTTGVTLNRLYTLLSELRIASKNGSFVVDTCSGRGGRTWDLTKTHAGHADYFVQCPRRGAGCCGGLPSTMKQAAADTVSKSAAVRQRCFTWAPTTRK